MAYDEKTLLALHKLTEEGDWQYKAMLERKADEILWNAAHPIKAFAKKLAKAFSAVVDFLLKHVMISA